MLSRILRRFRERGVTPRSQRLARIEKMQRTLEARQAKQLELLRELNRTTRELQKALVRLSPRDMTGRLARIEHGVQSLVRLETLERQSLPYPQRLTAHRFRLRSQNGEDGVTLALLEEVGIEHRRFAELGCGENGGNSGFMAEELGWEGLMVDGSPERLAGLRGTVSTERIAVVNAWMTAETINELLRENGLSGEIDVLSIDIDGIDYWLWSAIDEVDPRIVIVEYNSMFGADRAVVVPYDPEFRRRSFPGLKGTYYGASLRAFTRLGEGKGYRLVAVEARGANAYFLRNDVAPQIPACDPRAEFRLLDKYSDLLRGGFDFWGLVESGGLALHDLEAEPRLV